MLSPRLNSCNYLGENGWALRAHICYCWNHKSLDRTEYGTKRPKDIQHSGWVIACPVWLSSSEKRSIIIFLSQSEVYEITFPEKPICTMFCFCRCSYFKKPVITQSSSDVCSRELKAVFYGRCSSRKRCTCQDETTCIRIRFAAKLMKLFMSWRVDREWFSY
jgi:hypothetical protein